MSVAVFLVLQWKQLLSIATAATCYTCLCSAVWDGRAKGNEVFLNSSQLQSCNISIKQVDCLLLVWVFFDCIMGGAKGQLRNFCAPFWDLGICNYRGKRKETYRGPAEKAFSDILRRGLVAMSFHGHICCLFDLDLHVFWWNVFKALYSFDYPCLWWFHFHKWSQRNPILCSLQHFYKDESSGFPGDVIKSRKTQHWRIWSGSACCGMRKLQ